MLKYLKYLPKTFNEITSKHWPLILFLHGVGERGSDINIVKRNGLPQIIEEGMQLPFIVIAPQCPSNTSWQIPELKMVLDDAIEKYPIDLSRIYLTGLSMGGFGTWRFAIEHPGIFAAIVPICGGRAKFYARKIKKIPTWVFHGALDNVVPIQKSKEMVDELRKLRADVKFTIYPASKHDSWTQTYKNPELYKWFLKYKKK